MALHDLYGAETSDYSDGTDGSDNSDGSDYSDSFLEKESVFIPQSA